ncbi:MAG: ATP-binding cassette domain-containing protein [Solirubrobacteraceae bacterium]
MTAARNAEAMVEVRDVFSVHRTNEGDAAALGGATLTVRRGESVCVLGPSGAGKTTLLRVIAGLQTPSAGVVRVLGQDIGRAPARTRACIRHRSMGLLSQHASASLPPDLRLRDRVALPRALRGVGRAARRHRIGELLSATGLADRAAARPGELSGGERQRAALCMAIAHRPALLLADEPTGELDAVSARDLLALIADLAGGDRATAIVVSHDPAAARAVQRGVRMRDGRVVEELGDNPHGGSILVAPSGWLSLPPALLRGAGIVGRARVRPAGGGLLLSADPAAAPVPPSPRARPERAVWAPATIELHAVVRTRGHGPARRTVLDGLSRVLTPGRVHAVAGSSGSGKTTLLRLVAGLDLPDSGAILIDAHDLAGDGAEARAALRRGRIGYLAQEPAPIGFLSAEENIVLVLRWRGWSDRDARARAAAVLDRVGLTERARQHATRLSAGEAQRLALARALAGARGLLIVDEPTSRLDEANAGRTAELLIAAARVDGHTVLCATHDERLLAIADSVIDLSARSA